jgi:putative transposase
LILFAINLNRFASAIRVKRKLNSTKVTDALTDLCIIRGVSGYLQSDHGPEVIAAAVRMWIKAVAVNTADIEPASPGKN